MDKNRKIQIGLVSLIALLLIANLFGGGFTKWFGKSEADRIREAAASGMVNTEATSGNIPGTNVNQTPAPTGPVTTIRYDKDKYEFGVVDEGEVVKHAFKFTNTGSEPLVINNCKGSCGCTVPTWPHEPIPPGGTGEIMVEFNTKGKPGNQSKRVTVTANTVPTDTYLEVAGEVRGRETPATKGK
ncbi:MAG: DUF1573 domain-containing protein [Chitinophagales bacterium]|jgi:hypothetical protein